MEGSKQFCVTYNNNLKSSMKYTNFEGMSKKEIILKYENLLRQREKTIQELCSQLGNINQKCCVMSEKLEEIQKKNEEINNSIIKNETLLKQELTNKDILFITINNLTNENDKLKQMINDNCTDASKINEDYKKRGRSLNIENRSGIMKSHTLNFAINNNTNLLNSTNVSNTEPPEKNKSISDSKILTKKKKHKKDDKKGNSNLKTKRLASESIDYKPLFK